MKQSLRASLVTLLILVCGVMYAQTQTRIITGTVKDDKGMALPFVTVQVKGTTIGTYTDTAGHFTLAVDSTAKTLLLTMQGLKTTEVPITGNNMEITMKSDVLGLSEVVVTAVGISLEKKSLGYATQVVGSNQVNTTGTSNIMSELDGKVAGLTVVNSAGDPGAGTYINLRGVTSITGNNQPLIVIDGVPIDNSINNYDPTNAGAQASGANGNLTGGVQPTNRGLDIDPNDIESITVLKGPAATALYGIEAASGALIITTKKGGKAKVGLGIEFNSSLTFSTYNKLPALQNQWGQGDNDQYFGPTSSGSNKKFSWGPPIDSLYWNGNTTSNAANNYAGSYDPHGEIVLKGDPTAKTAVTPYDPYSFFQTGVGTDNNISFSGGSDKTSYRVGLGNYYQTGIIPLSKYIKNNVSLSGSVSLTKRLKVSSTIDYVNSTDNKVQQGSNISSVMLGLMRTPPTFDNSNGYGNKDPTNTAIFELPDGFGSQRDYRGGLGYDNPYWTVNQNPFVSTLNRVFGHIQLDYHAFDWMNITYRAGGDVYSQDDKNVYDIGSNAFPSGAIYLNDYFSKIFNSDFIVTLNHDFGQDFSGSLILGQNYYSNYFSNRFTTGSNFYVPHFLDMSNASFFQSSESEVGIRRSAWYAEAQLGWMRQLYLTLTGRDETSSTLPSNNDNFFYPSASLGWVFTEPLHLTTNKVFPYGKLRLSFAGAGKDAQPYSLQTYYHVASEVDGFTSPGIVFPFNNQPGYQISNLISVMGNNALVPEHTNTFEIGTDLAFFENRISFNFTYYSEDTKNGIFQVPVPYSTGWAAQVANAAEITNKGEEITLNTIPIKTKSGFEWDLGFNWSHNSNLVVSLSPGVQEILIAGFTNGAIEALPGQPFGVIYGTDYVKASDGKLIIDDNPSDPGYGMPIPGSQSQALGNIQPKWIGGMTNTFSFMNFSLDVILTVHEGGDIWDGTLGALEYFGTAEQTNNRNQSTTFSGELGHVDIQGNIVHNTTSGTAPGPGGAANIPSSYNEYYWQNVGSSFIGPTSTGVYDGSYVRISQISLGYKFPDKWVKKAHFTMLKLSLFANNPILWTKYPGVDPQTSLAGPANGQGLDYFNAPGIKSYGVRLDVGL